MDKNETKTTSLGSVYELEGRPSFAQALPLGFQQILAMFVGNIVPMIIVANAAQMSSAQATLLLQCALLGAGVATLLQVCTFRFGNFQIGSGLPVMMGLTYTFLPICTSVAVEYGLGTLFGAQLVGGVISVIIGLILPKIRKFFPPIVTGTIITSIGISCFPMAAYNLAGGQGDPSMGQPHNFIIGAIVVLAIVLLNGYGKGLVSSAAILLGMIIGYIVAAVTGYVDFSPIAEAAWFTLPQPLAYGILELVDIKSSPYPGASVVPDYCRATYDRRLLVGETKEGVLKPLEELLEKMMKEDPQLKAKVSYSKGEEKCWTGETISAERFFPAWLYDKNEDWIQNIYKEMKAIGLNPTITNYDFCTNGSHYAGEAGIKTVGVGPSLETLAHTINEYIELDQLTKVMESYYGVMKALLK